MIHSQTKNKTVSSEKRRRELDQIVHQGQIGITKMDQKIKLLLTFHFLTKALIEMLDFTQINKTMYQIYQTPNVRIC